MSRYFIVEPPQAVTPTPVYDYTSSLSSISNIATQLSNIDADTTPMAATLALIATSVATIANKQTAMETHLNRLKELGETTGIRIVGPYEWLGFIPSYINYIEKGEILNIEGKVSPEKIAEALAELESYFNKINSLPTNF